MNRRLPIADCKLPIEFGSEGARCSSIQHSKYKFQNCRAFTLIELMMVVAIIGLVMAMSVPAILSVLREGPLRKAVNDTLDICNTARAQAILRGQMTLVSFHPRTEEISCSGAADSSAPSRRVGQKVANSAQYDSSVDIAMLDINLMDFGASDEARVRFYPNGTCDEMTLVLHSGDQWRKITLEPTTSLASVSSVK
jgi:prepilin-type N-terminal cleavage/methylation domain-containing protein